MNQIQAVSFDADQTLWDFGDVYRRALATTIAAMVERGDATADQATPETLKRIRDEVVLEHRGAAHNLEVVREQSFRVFLEGIGHAAAAEAAAELVDIYMDVRFGSIELYPEVVEVLGRLKSRYRIGLLTNGNTYPERCGLPGVFDAEVLGPSHGFEKPDPRAFETLAAALGLECASIMHVGDDWDDIEGANAVGAVSVFMNRTAASPAFAADADYEVTNLVEVEALLSS